MLQDYIFEIIEFAGTYEPNRLYCLGNSISL